MKQLRFEEKDKLPDILEAIHKTSDEEIEITISGGQVLDLTLDKKVLTLAAEKLGKKLTFRDKTQPRTPQPQTHEKPTGHGFVEGEDVAEPKTEAKPEAGTPVKKRNWFSKLPFLKGPKWVYIVLGAVLLFIVVGATSFWLLPSAKVTLFTTAQFQEAEFPLTASETIQKADKEAGMIPLKVLESSQEDSIETQSTGSKTVGSKAKGRVKVVNRDTSNSKTFFKGSVITTTSGPNVSFTLDKSATLSAAPVGCEADCPQVGVDITAKVIGDSGNLKSGTVFKVGDADVNLVFAKNETNFSGGSSKKITIVSADDHKKSKEDLLKKLEEAVKKKLETENPQIVIPEGGFENEITSEVYSQKVGDEKSSFRLSMEVKFSAKSFSENDLKEILIDEISDNIPNDFVLDPDNVIVSSEVLRQEGTDLNILGKIKAALLPAINEEEVKRNISGKDFGSVDGYLQSLNSVSGFEIKVMPSPFRIFGILPLLKNKIDIDIKAED